jgi:hypothetical protein
VTQAAINALDEALAVNRLLVRQATLAGDFDCEADRYLMLSALEIERVQLQAGLRVLLTETVRKLSEIRGKPQIVAGLASPNHEILAA